MECGGTYCSLGYSMQSSLKLLCRHLSLYSYSLRKGVPVLALGVLLCGQVVKMSGVLGKDLSPECGSGPAQPDARHTVYQPRGSGFLSADPCNGVKLNMAREDFYPLVIQIIYTYRTWFH